jgi:hypothetical protein
MIDELKHIVEGGEVGEYGKASLRGINYNAVCFLHTPYSNTRVEPNSEGATGANKRTTTSAFRADAASHGVQARS